MPRLACPTVIPALLASQQWHPAADVIQQYGLLFNDALVVAIMTEQGLTQVASNDADFDRVPGITRFAPV